jgi:holo-[acyl-carrier protein] synthase
MTLGLGCDIIEIGRIRNSIKQHDQHFLDRMFTLAEQNYCNKYRDPAPHFAARFAAKEAVVKALGTGISHLISWLDIEILNDERGKPHVILSPKAQNNFNLPQLQLTMSHCKEYAMAVVIWLS